MLENAVNEICWVFLFIKFSTSKNIFDWSRFKCFQEEIMACCLRKSPRISNNWTSQNLKKNQNDQISRSIFGSTARSFTSGGTRFFLPSLGCSLCCWSRSQEGKFKIFPIDPANQYVEYFAFVKNVMIDRTLLLWHTRLQKSRSTACRNNVDCKLTNAAWTCRLRQYKSSKKSFCL